MNIGDSINEAIDWAQDRLVTTRPLAEHTLFSMMAKELVHETEAGYVLAEAAEEEVEKYHQTAKNNMKRNRSRFKFHVKRKTSKQRFSAKMKHLDSSDAADDMLAADDAESSEK